MFKILHLRLWYDFCYYALHCHLHFKIFSPLRALLLVVDGISGDGGGVLCLWPLPGQGHEPRAGDDSLQTLGRSWEATEATEATAPP